MVNDDTVGSCNIKLDELFMKGVISQWYPLLYNGDKAGSVYVEMQFIESPQAQP